MVAFRNTGAPERKVLMSTVSVQVDAQVPRGNVVRVTCVRECVCVRVSAVVLVISMC